MSWVDGKSLRIELPASKSVKVLSKSHRSRVSDAELGGRLARISALEGGVAGLGTVCLRSSTERLVLMGRASWRLTAGFLTSGSAKEMPWCKSPSTFEPGPGPHRVCWILCMLEFSFLQSDPSFGMKKFGKCTPTTEMVTRVGDACLAGR